MNLADPGTVQFALVVLAFLFAGVVVWRLDRPSGRWGAALRRRFVMGVPWGTLVVTGVVLSVYLFLQGGAAHWYAPTVVPFRAWSYFYPLGMLTGAFAHSGPAHLLGNLTGTLAFASLCEYAWGHFPRERGSHSFRSPISNPFVRAFVVFPAVGIGVGLLTGLFALGPIVGFSGAVFAFAGFALVRYPYATLVALLASRAAGTVRRALIEPTLVSRARPIFYRPWWADIAVQGHLLGLLIGVLLGFWFLRSRARDRPRSLRLWTAVLLFSLVQSLWVVYWFRGNAQFVLYRAAGVVLVVALATLITAGVGASERPLTPRLRQVGWLAPSILSLLVSGALLALYGLSGTGAVTLGRVTVPVLPVAVGAAFLTALAFAGLRPTIPNPVADVPRRRAAMVLVLLGTAAVAGPAIPVNLTTVSDQPLPGEPTDVRDYEITYAENVTNGMVSVVDVSALGETTNVRTSGVIVRSQRRGIWTTAVTRSRLAFDGNVTVRVGGVGWRESVLASRDGWRAAGGERAYRIAFYDDGRRDVVYVSEPARASPTIAGRNVSVVPGADRFALAVSRGNETLARAPIPPTGAAASAGGLRFVRRNGAVYALHDGTRVQIAAKETYE